jgi:hypothetical protein
LHCNLHRFARDGELQVAEAVATFTAERRKVLDPA